MQLREVALHSVRRKDGEQLERSQQVAREDD